MKYSSRFFLWGPFGLFITLAAGVMVHWWFAAEDFSKRLDALNGHEVMPGMTIRFASKTVSGFPFRLDALFENLAVTVATAHGPAVWHTGHFAMHALTYGRAQEIFEAAGRQFLSWTDDAGHAHALQFVPAALRASSIGDEKGLARFDLDLISADGKDTLDKKFTVGRAQLHMRRDPNKSGLDLMLSADELNEPGGITPLFGDHLHTLRLYMLFTQAGSFARLLKGEESWPDATSGWHRQGGQLQIGLMDIKSAGPDAFRGAAPDGRKSLGELVSSFF